MTIYFYTLKLVISALYSNLTSITGWKNSGSFNDLKKNGLYMTSGLSDGPNVSGVSTWAVLVMSSGATGVDGTTVKQMAFVQNGANIYTRQFIAGTWSDWTSQPTRSEIDTLNNSLGNVSFKSVDLAANSTTSYTISSNSRMVLFLLGADANALCIFLVSATSGGSITRVKIGDGSAITHTVGTNTLTLQDSGSGNMQVRALIFAGDISRAS